MSAGHPEPGGSSKFSFETHFSDYVKHAGPGYFLAVAGFVLLTAGAIIGARSQPG